jgi:hypothetical protein
MVLKGTIQTKNEVVGDYQTTTVPEETTVFVTGVVLTISLPLLESFQIV